MEKLYSQTKVKFGKLLKIIIFFILIIFSFGSYSASWLEMDVAELQSLDKITARIDTHEIKIEEELIIGNLLIKIKSCQKKPPFLPPESASFIQIYDMIKNDNPSLIFSGWMFASSPALSSLEHAIYDISLISCKKERSILQSEEFSELTSEK